MRTQLRNLWHSRPPRERSIIAVLAAILVVLSYVGLLYSAAQGRTALQSRVTLLRAQAEGLDRQALEYSRLATAPAMATSATELRALVQAQIGDAGLARALASLDAPDANRVVLAFGALSFADWLGLVTRLQAQQVSLEACRIEALSTPGLVSVTATFGRGRT